MVCLAACAPSGELNDATMQADLQNYATEVALLRDGSSSPQNDIIATVSVAETQAAGYFQYNTVLLATVRAVSASTPVPQAFQNVTGGPQALSIYDTSSGRMQMVQTGVSGFVRPDDRCFETHQNFFTTSSLNAVYFVAVGLNMPAGTTIDVQWFYEGQPVYSNGLTISSGVDAQCIAIALQPSNVALSPGNWSAAVSLNGEPFMDPIPFTIIQG